MFDVNANWRNHRWYFDADYTERESAPLLVKLIEKFGFFFDETYAYILQGKTKQYVIRFPHYGGTRWDPRIPTERPKIDRSQQKLQL